MHIIKNISNFLKDQEYYIDIFSSYLHVYSYEELISLTSTLIELKLKEFNLQIIGENLLISNMDNHEILIKGTINEVKFLR